MEIGGIVNPNLIFYQLFDCDTSTYTYLLADEVSREAVLIDPVYEKVDRDLKLINEIGLNLKYVLDTHIHADHITGAGEIRKRTSAKTGVSEKANVDCSDLPLKEGGNLSVGPFQILIMETPGHTDSCLSFFVEGMIFTGDALLIRGTGRTDFQQGSSEKLYDSIFEKIYRLPGKTKLFPGHDYHGQTSSTIELEMKYNQRINSQRAKSDFIRLMAELKLADPKRIHEALPANMACGHKTKKRILSPQVIHGVSEISPELVKPHLGKLRIIDVRRDDEFNGELGHIPGAELVSLGSSFENWLETADIDEEVLIVCRSGARSGQATAAAQSRGLHLAVNMTGGMLRWNELGYKSVKD